MGISTRTFGLSAVCVASAADQMDAREASIISIAAALSVNRVGLRRTVDRYMREGKGWMRLTNLILFSNSQNASAKTRQFWDGCRRIWPRRTPIA